ncbi:MAG: hypothetical protein K2Y22_15945 [Candidatus Obscuribacterales bacterium]|nr:hypothetical protein [Candidatus Obscuribacterales bacterium]
MSERTQDRLHSAVSRATPTVAEATIAAIEATTGSDLKSTMSRVVMVRVLRAVASMLQKADSLDGAASAKSDLEVLLTLLEMPEVLAALKKDDPIAPAKLRGVRAMDALAQAGGGCVSGEEAGNVLKVSRQAVDKARREGRLIALPRGQNRWVYPIWQFHEGTYLNGLTDVLAELKESGPYGQVTFFLNKNSRLTNKAPLDLLRKEPVISAARLYGQHGAV